MGVKTVVRADKKDSLRSSNVAVMSSYLSGTNTNEHGLYFCSFLALKAIFGSNVQSNTPR